MLINGKAFGGTTYYLDTYKYLLATRDNLPWLSDFQLSRFPHSQFIHRLLCLFHVHRLCFYLTGSLVYYSVGVFNSFNAVGMFITLTQPKHNILDLIFQRIPSPSFSYDNFIFELVNREPNSDVFFYDTYDLILLIRLRFVFFGVDTTQDYGP